jgi:hypothetical protein
MDLLMSSMASALSAFSYMSLPLQTLYQSPAQTRGGGVDIVDGLRFSLAMVFKTWKLPTFSGVVSKSDCDIFS